MKFKHVLALLVMIALASCRSGSTDSETKEIIKASGIKLARFTVVIHNELASALKSAEFPEAPTKNDPHFNIVHGIFKNSNPPSEPKLVVGLPVSKIIGYSDAVEDIFQPDSKHLILKFGKDLQPANKNTFERIAEATTEVKKIVKDKGQMKIGEVKDISLLSERVWEIEYCDKENKCFGVGAYFQNIAVNSSEETLSPTAWFSFPSTDHPDSPAGFLVSLCSKGYTRDLEIQKMPNIDYSKKCDISSDKNGNWKIVKK